MDGLFKKLVLLLIPCSLLVIILRFNLDNDGFSIREFFLMLKNMPLPSIDEFIKDFKDIQDAIIKYDIDFGKTIFDGEISFSGLLVKIFLILRAFFTNIIAVFRIILLLIRLVISFITDGITILQYIIQYLFGSSTATVIAKLRL